MAYDATKPLDDGYLADAPAELRELFRALKEDKIVNAGKLNGYTQGNANGNIPLNNGTLNTNLNADLLDGHDSAYFSASTHGHDGATTNAAGFMTTTQVTKLNGIATGAEVNQNAFSNVKVGSSTIQADGKMDTLTLAAGNAITLTADTTNDKVTIAVTSSTYLPLAGGTMTGALTFANGVWNPVGDDVKIGDFNKAGLLGVMGANGTTGIAFCKRDDAATYKAITFDGTNLSLGGYTLLKSVPADAKFTDTVYTHPTTAGNKHIPAGGASMDSLIYSSAGTATWGYPKKITTKSASTNAERHVFFAYDGDDNQVVYNDNFMYNPSTGNLAVRKINGCTIAKSVPADAKFTDTVYTHPTSAGNKHIPSGGSSGQILKYSAAGTAAWSSLSDANIFPKPTTASGVGQLYQCGTSTAREFTLPSGGTWFYVMECFNANSTSIGTKVGTAAGGAKVTALNTTDTRSHCWAIRIV